MAVRWFSHSRSFPTSSWTGASTIWKRWGCCNYFRRRCDSRTGYRIADSPQQQPLSDDPVLVLCIVPFGSSILGD